MSLQASYVVILVLVHQYCCIIAKDPKGYIRIGEKFMHTLKFRDTIAHSVDENH